ncbi:hypothetical protein LUZ60_006848 [Juncus effusus]|nr:hypothetical protein LUZ60_006848 [Juncus effusus]
MSELIIRAWTSYLRQLDCHPLRTKAITAGVMSGLSDAIAQRITGNKHIQMKRVMLMMLTGFAYLGPFDHFMRKILNKLFKGNSKETFAKKMFIQEFVIAPMNNMLFLAFYGKFVEGRPFSAVKQKIRNDFPSIQLAAWKFWPLITYLSYQYVPLKLHLLCANIIGVGWGVFLNLKARSVAPSLK